MAIEHISDTARWVAMYRAMETGRPDAIFRDPFARRLAGDRGAEIVRQMPRGVSMAWAMIVRTAVFDEIILDVVKDSHADMVVNLAAGLDTRAWRLPLPAGLQWVDVDLPDVLEYKSGVLRAERPVCRYEALPADLTADDARATLFARLGTAAARVLIVTEGLLVYLAPDQVGALARALASVRSMRWWLTDLGSPLLLRFMTRTWGRAVAAGNAPFRFGPAEGPDFFRPFGWRETIFRPTADEARRLRRQMRGIWFWNALARLAPKRRREQFRRMSAFLLLERDEPDATALPGRS